MSDLPTNLPSVGRWTELKNAIIDKYTVEYLKIMNQQSDWCEATLYVDAYAGSPENVSRETAEVVPGSTRRALAHDPGFTEYHFIDTNLRRAQDLESLKIDLRDVHVHHADANQVLSEVIVPRLAWENRRRGFVLLDPYSLNLKWEVVHALGATGAADVVINFPIGDAVRNPLRRSLRNAKPTDVERMTTWWGDESWKELFYETVSDVDVRRWATGFDIAQAYCQRLVEFGNFRFATTPMPFANSSNAVMYYLLLASQKRVATKIMDYILNQFRRPQQGRLF